MQEIMISLGRPPWGETSFLFLFFADTILETQKPSPGPLRLLSPVTLSLTLEPLRLSASCWELEDASSCSEEHRETLRSSCVSEAVPVRKAEAVMGMTTPWPAVRKPKQRQPLGSSCSLLKKK